MEKVWDELKKIELQAEKIRVEAQNKSTQLAILAKKEGEQLVTNARTYAEEDSQQFYHRSIQEANMAYEEKLKIGEAVGEKLILQAEKHVEKCVDIIVMAVLGENNRAADDKIR
jgi:hypothetical protein